MERTVMTGIPFGWLWRCGCGWLNLAGVFGILVQVREMRLIDCFVFKCECHPFNLEEN